MRNARRQILSVAANLVRTHGFAQVKRRHIAAKAQVTPTLVNYYFDSMRTLREEIIAANLKDEAIIAHAIIGGLYTGGASAVTYQRAVEKAARIRKSCLA